MVRPLLVLACGLAGLVLGPAVNSVIDGVRVPDDHGRSVRRRSAGSRGATALRPLVVQVTTAALFAAAAQRLGSSLALPAFCVFLAVLVAVSVIDLDHHLIPNRIVYPAFYAGVLLLGAAAALGGEWGRLETAALGAVAGFAVLFSIWFVYPRGMGYGDVRLAGLIGLHLGWLGLGHVAVGLFCAFLFASVVGVGLMAARVKSRKDHVPFGPFLAAGAVVAVLFGTPLVTWYLA